MMRLTTPLLTTVLLLLISGAGWAQEPEVKRVTNPSKPVKPAYQLVFEEDLRFGGDEDNDNLLWPNTSTLVTSGPTGKIYVADTAGKRVLEFSPSGEFLREVAQPGQGPGEFRGLPSFQMLLDGSARGTDSVPMSIPRFYSWDADLKFDKDIVPSMDGKGTPISAYFSPRGNAFYGNVIKLDMAGRKMQLGFALFDDGMKKLDELSSFEMAMLDPSKMMDPGAWKAQMVSQLRYVFSGLGAAAFDAQGRIYVADRHTYKITRYDPEFTKADLIIERDYQRIPYTEADVDGLVQNTVDQVLQSPMPQLREIFTDSFIRSAVAEAELPTYKWPIQGLQITDEGDILVLHDTNGKDGTQVIDVFSPDGRYLGQNIIKNKAFYDVFLNRPRMSFRSGKAYTLEVNEDGDAQAVRYTVRRVKR